MNSHTLLTRAFSLNFPRSLRIIFAVLLLLGFSAASSNAQTFYTDWTATADPLVFNFTLPDGTTGTITKTNTACAGAANTMSLNSVAHGGPANYPSSFYTPTPPNPLEFVGNGINRDGTLPGCASATAVVNNYVITFSETTANLRFHYINLDSGTWRFFDSVMTPINVTRLSGNTDFEVSGNAVNSTPLDATAPGCDTAVNTADTGGCGSIVVPGKYTQLRVTGTDSNPTGSGDGHLFTISISDDHGDAPASYDNNGVGEASHDLLALNLRLGASVDADAAEKSGIPATGDDTTGSDDEDGAGTFQSYFSAGGRMCTGALGTYTTLANEYCTVVTVTNSGASAGQVVGWLDANGDGDFLDAGERSVPLNDPAVDDGSFATGNSPVSSTRLVVLVWTGLPQTLPSNPYFRFRVSRDATFFTDPQPLGAAIDGEVEDHRAAVPTAADAMIAGRVVTADGRGIRNVVVTVQGGELAEPRTALTNAFGYYSIEELDAGETYVVSVRSKRYQFENPVRVVSLGEDATGVDFVAGP